MKYILTLLAVALSLSSCAQHAVESAPTPPSGKELLSSSKTPGTTLGDLNAPTQIAVFQDTNCGMCRKMWREVVNGSLKEQIAQGKVAYRFVEFPLGLAANSSVIAVAGKCAAEQNKYREFMNVVYTTKGEHGEKELTAFSKKAGLNISKMNECMNSGRGKDAAKLDVALGNALGVQGTPTFFINGEQMQGNWTEPKTWNGIVAR